MYPMTPGQLGDAPVQEPDEGSVFSEAAQYVRDRWQAFLDLSSKIIDLQHRAALAAQNYRAQGNLEMERAAKALIQELANLQQLHHQAVTRFEYLAPYVGLGALQIPVLVATGFSAAALVLLWFFRKMEIQEQALDLVESGQLSEQAFRDMNAELGRSPLTETYDFAKLALWGFLGWLAFQAFSAYRSNPPLVVFGNPPGVISEDVHYIGYEHADDGRPYEHTFQGGVEMEALADGSVLISHRSKPVWRDF